MPSPTFETQLKAFERHLCKEDLSSNTIRVYVHDLKVFDQWLGEVYGNSAASLDNIGTPDLAAFRKHLLQERSLKPATVNRRINSLRAFFSWRQTKGREDNPALKLRFVRQAPQQRPRCLKQTEVLALMRAASQSAHGTSLRNEAILQLMLQAGLRVAEVVGLQHSDLILQARSGSVRVRSGKGMKQRSVPLNATARRTLVSYLDHGGKGKTSEPLFLSKRQTALSIRSVQDVVSGLAARSSINRMAVSAHTLRHTFAVNYLRNSPGKLVELAALMGHDSLDTTAVYLRPSEEDLSDDLEKSPLNVLGD